MLTTGLAPVVSMFINQKTRSFGYRPLGACLVSLSPWSVVLRRRKHRPTGSIAPLGPAVAKIAMWALGAG
jgi:hypothetical protein